MSPIVWGLDIGGTKIGWSIGTTAGALLARGQYPTPPRASPQEALEPALEALGVAGVEGPSPAAIGAACPGPMSSRQGAFHDPPNMPRWHGFGLAAFLAERTGLPVGMMNDANAAALAEWWWGAARGASTAVFLTMSTGMGAGLIIDGRLHQGADDLAGEVGHIRLDPDGPVGFGKRGSVEGFLSGPGLRQLAGAEARVARQLGSPTALLREGALRDDLTPEIVCRLSAEGDVAARRATDRAASALGRLMAIITDLLNPEVFVLGTIGAAWPQLFVPGARAVMAREAIGRAAARVRVVSSGLGERRGDLQAVAAAIHALGLSPEIDRR